MPLDSVLAALRAPRRSSGELIIGLKEAGAVRGVGVHGEMLPVAARDSAVTVIRAAFPQLTIVRISRTALVVRGPLSRRVLQRLRALAVVDYLEPNWTNGVTGGPTR